MKSQNPSSSLNTRIPRFIIDVEYFRSFLMGSKDGAVLRALASHQCGAGSNPGVDAICGLSLSSVPSFAPRGFSPVTPVFPSPQKPTTPSPIRSGTHNVHEFLRTPKCSVGKQNYKFQNMDRVLAVSGSSRDGNIMTSLF